MNFCFLISLLPWMYCSCAKIVRGCGGRRQVWVEAVEEVASDEMALFRAETDLLWGSKTHDSSTYSHAEHTRLAFKKADHGGAQSQHASQLNKCANDRCGPWLMHRFGVELCLGSNNQPHRKRLQCKNSLRVVHATWQFAGVKNGDAESVISKMSSEERWNTRRVRDN